MGGRRGWIGGFSTTHLPNDELVDLVDEGLNDRDLGGDLGGGEWGGELGRWVKDS